MKKLILIELLIMWVVAISAQVEVGIHGQEKLHIVEKMDETGSCGTEERHTYLMRHDPEYKQQFLLHQRLLDSVLALEINNRTSQPPQYTIPVVVHVIHLGEPVGSGSNISDAQIQSAITGLNQRFANNNGQGLNIEIDFCLANRDPNGCPTSGINRVNGSGVPLYASDGIEFNNNCGAEETSIKDLSKWSTLDYYNVWVVHNICGDWSGYAYYPNGGAYDGTVIDRNSMTSTSWTLSHELGHGLNLRHTFNGDNDGNSCPPNNNCTTEGDFICDTPPHKRGDCGSSNPCSSSGIWNNSRYNWMSYCNALNTVGRFTADQKTRMRTAMEVFPREELQNSLGCDGPETPVITSSNAPMCSGTTRALTGTPAGGTFTVFSGPGTINGTTLTATGTGTIVIHYTTCAGVASQNITAFQTPNPVITSSNSPMCTGTTRTLTATPGEGTFSIVSGPGSINGNILTANAAGMILIQYAVTQNGCTAITTQSITSIQTPSPVITSSNSPMCTGEMRTLAGNPAGGVFTVLSGPGTLAGNVLTANAVGTILIQYSVTQNGCTGTTTQNITVNQTPAPVITSSNSPMCSGETRTLTATPTGGTFSVLSGPGSVNVDILTANGAGTIVIQYSLTQNGCTGTTTQSITSNQTPMSVITSSADPMCSSQTRVLTATPSGGVFTVLSGPGTLNGNTLTATGEGVISIQYLITQNNCTGVTIQQITSYLTPSPVFTSDDSPICSEDTRLLTAIPTGGEFDVLSGPGTVNGNILTSTGSGLISIQYIITVNGCTGATEQSIPSFLTPEPEITSDTDPMCSGETRLLTALPPGGTFDVLSGPGSLNGNTLTAIEDGSILIQYELTQNNCTGFDLQTIVAYETPDPEITSDDTPMCSGEDRLLIAIPANGDFSVVSGPGSISGDVLTATGNGTILIEYIVEENNCVGYSTQQIISYESPEPLITSDDGPICQGDFREIVTEPAGGELTVVSGPGSLLGHVLTATGQGTILLSYTIEENDCEGEFLQSIPSYAIPTPTITSDLSPMCSGETRSLTGLPADGDFVLLSGPANLNGNQLTCLSSGAIVLAYEVDNSGCIGTTIESIEAHQTPTPGITAMAEMCENQTQVLSGQPAGGSFSILLGPGSLNGDILTATGFGIISVNYAVAQNGCIADTTAHIIALIEPTPVITSTDDSLCTGNARPVTGTPAGGQFMVVSGAATITNNMLTAHTGGTIVIEYAVTANGCTGVTQQTIQAIPSPIPVFLNENSPMCFNETRIIEVMPQGGALAIISGPGVLHSDTLSPTGSGIITLQYIVEVDGCSAVAIQEIGVSIGEQPMITSNSLPICSGTTKVLTGTPVGGVFSVLSGPGFIQDSVLTAVSEGNILIAYETCAGSASQIIVCKESPQPIITSSGSPICEGEKRALHASIPGGDFVILDGPGTLQGDSLLPLGDGIIELEYSLIKNECFGADTQYISSITPPEIGVMQIQNALVASPDTGVFQWVDCDLGYHVIPDETSSVFVPEVSGHYALVYTFSVCTDTSVCLPFIVSGYSTPWTQHLKLYPNPVNNRMFLQLPDDVYGPLEVRLIDIAGRTMLIMLREQTIAEQSTLELDMQEIPAGVYMCLVKWGTAYSTGKIVVQ